ncbi:MAG: penicillin-binding transpeptidase domain-containing protein, partial [bacterium]|nr:penicillin-binding transpeptidase domain-containing protein [bacterium]
EDCFDEMVLRYDLQGYEKDIQRLLMGVRYSMERSGFSLNTPFTMAKDIPTDLMTYIKESMSSVPGIQIVVSTYREYSNGTVAPHLLGTVGKIYAEQWEELKSKGYKYSDLIGKSGIEAVYEDYLRGKDGKLAYCFDDDGNVVSTEIVEQPVQGNTVMLSIDKKIQMAAQTSLQNVILEANAKDGVVTGAAAVVVDIDTGELLAAVNYPYYDLNSYTENFQQLSNASNKPLFDRAFNGVYPPGSAFKPLVAIAALNNNTITKDECIDCVGTYRYYTDFTPSCMKVHRSQNVINALSNSCNYFFFDVGRRLGIEKITQYARGFGLGEKTGIEIDESAGILAGPEHCKTVGTVWYGGNVVQAAIGQSDNSFTPLQLAMYMTTIVNSGTRYKASLLNQIRSYNLEEIVYDYKPVVLNKVSIQDSVINIVKQGLLSVTEEGTAQRYFNDYSIKVGGKTGTAENPGADHATFIAFAPYDDPQIAVSIVVEHGEYSTTTVPVAKAIFDAYFLDVSDSYIEPSANTLIQ